MKEGPPKRPNIVWIIPDDTSHGMLGFGGGKALSPNLDSIAQNGVQLSQFHCSSPACAPSRYSYFTGHYGGRCPSDNFSEQGASDEPYSVFFNTDLDPSKEISIGRALQLAGYRTGHVGKWHIHAAPDDKAAIPRFDPDDDPRDPAINQRLEEHQNRVCDIVRKAGFDYAHSVIWGNHETLPKNAKNHNIEWIIWGALQFIDQCAEGDAPFFLSMATTTIHGPNHISSLLADPYLTAGGYTDEHIGCQPSRQSIYERISAADGVEFNSTTVGVLWMDDAVGAVLEKLREHGLERDTLVIFSGDHGPSIGGKFTTYERGTRIPFIAQWPGTIPAGLICDGFAQNVDFAPTMLDAAGAVIPEDMVVDGKSIMPLLTGESNELDDRDDLFFEFGYARAVRTRKWKYIAWRLPESLIERMKSGEIDNMLTQFGRPIRTDITKPDLVMAALIRYPGYFDADQLYDLENDPHETRNLAYEKEFAPMLEDMRGRLVRYLETFDQPFPLDDPGDFYTSERFKQLKAKVMERVEREKIGWIADMKFIGFADADEEGILAKA